MRETYVSIDIEADGPIPGPHSMLSLGAVAFSAEGVEVDAFSVNLSTLEGAAGHPDTMAWWQTQPKAWATCREDPQDPAVAMPRFSAWLKALPGRPVAVGYPVAFDFMFVHWYLHRFTGGSPLSHSALDMKTLAWTILGGHYRDATKRHMPRQWFLEESTHSHVAVADAREQGHLFFGMRRALQRAADPAP